MNRGQLTATHWGNYWIATDGNTVTVTPSEHDPYPSPIGASLAATHDKECRVTRPSIRLGYLRDRSDSDTTRRGKEPFVEVEWDEALDIVAEALRETKSTRGNDAIYGGSYGWSSAGRFHHAQSQIHRFLRGFGGYTDSVGSYSFAAGQAIFPHIMGYDAFAGILQTPSNRDITENCGLLVYFGGAPFRNSQVNPGGVGQHNVRDQIEAIRTSGLKTVNVSPIRDDVDAALGAEWWPCRPNSDTAIMLALAHTLFVEDLHDRSYLDRYTVGFDNFVRYILGESDGQAKDADWASALSELPADDIRALARRMAKTPTLLSVSLSIQRAEHGEQPYWAVITLAAMLGTIGKRGLGFIMSSGVGKMASLQRRILPFDIAALPQGDNPIRDFIPVSRITEMLEEPGRRFNYNGHSHTYPDIRLIYWAGGNPFHHHQDLNRMRQAWAHPRTIITHEINWTTTARYADIVLPCTSPLEREDFAGSRSDNSLMPMPPVLPPFGEARDDYTIFSDLASRLGFQQVFTEGLTANQWVERLYERTRENAEKGWYCAAEVCSVSAGTASLSGRSHSRRVVHQ
ncbi:molybdopterin-dependent oxidoreductase [Bradyrhizobium sp. RDM4]|uniref:molybdopterin-dependent oxidoreductase n=1 Tax=Bradyrhizobium sp. RDM4 TaxID=3378765 RepID=UPI0038FC6DFB